MLGLMVISPLIIAVLFGHGEFVSQNVDNIDKVSMGVAAHSVGLLSFMLIKVLAPGFYARQDTKTPVSNGIITMVLNMVFNLILAPFIGYLGLALAPIVGFVQCAIIPQVVTATGLSVQRLFITVYL